MSHDTYQFLLYAMSVAGAVVFVALYFVRAGIWYVPYILVGNLFA